MKSRNAIAMYLRVSTDGQSTESQHLEIERYLVARGWNENVKIYEDKGFTGTNTDRVALQELLKDCRQRKIDTIVCFKLDRLCRSLKDLINILNELNELQIAFISIKDQIDMTTSSGRLMMHIVGAFAEFEASIIRERVRSGINVARLKGKHIGRRQKGMDKEIIELRSDGMSLRSIAKELNISKGAVQTALARCTKTPIENKEPVSNDFNHLATTK